MITDITTADLERKALRALQIVRLNHDTTEVPAEAFAELAAAILFYLRGGHSPARAADLAAEEIFLRHL